ncbi:MAG: hypothetical protein AB7Q37_09945 [Pyrinomonadaceae bacterium]
MSPSGTPGPQRSCFSAPLLTKEAWMPAFLGGQTGWLSNLAPLLTKEGWMPAFLSGQTGWFSHLAPLLTKEGWMPAFLGGQTGWFSLGSDHVE